MNKLVSCEINLFILHTCINRSLISDAFLTRIMKPLYASVLAILTSVTIIGMVTISTQHVFAPRECPGCAEFQKLTDEFEKAVLDAAAGNPDTIPSLVDEYSSNVKTLFESPSPSP